MTESTLPKSHLDHSANRYASGQAPRWGDVVAIFTSATAADSILRVDRFDVHRDDGPEAAFVVLDCAMFEADDGAGTFVDGYAEAAAVQPAEVHLIARGPGPGEGFDVLEGLRAADDDPFAPDDDDDDDDDCDDDRGTP
jgi:hypothetical protein